MSANKICISGESPESANDDDDICSIRTKVDIPICGGMYTGTFMTFRNLSDGKEHIVIGLGDWENTKEPLVRLHSECLTGDIFGSQKCDCGKQLNEAITRIYEEGGFLIYLRQEGRGIGLYNKLDAYVLQAAGMDTFQANRALGFDNDLRDYQVAAQMLRALNKTRIRLLSSNIDKYSQLIEYGITVVERTKTSLYCNQHNKHYLASKAQQASYDICIEELFHD